MNKVKKITEKLRKKKSYVKVLNKLKMYSKSATLASLLV